MAARCCRCASIGRCIICLCVRSGRQCSDCHPSMKGSCMNQSPVNCSSSVPSLGTSEKDGHVDATVNRLGLDSVGDSDEGNLSSDSSLSFSQLCKVIYEEVVHWSADLMKTPLGGCGKDFVTVLSELFKGFRERCDSDALYSAFVLPKLLLQRPSNQSRDNTNRKILVRRLQMWKAGNLMSLVEEGRVTQAHQKRRFTRSKSNNSNTSISRSFANLMFQGRVGAALSLEEIGGVLSLDDEINGISVKTILREKHPKSQAVNVEAVSPLSDSASLQSYSVLFDSLDASAIRRAALASSGAAGPSGLHAYSWRRICSAFGKISDDICHSIACMARHLCVVELDPLMLVPLLACRLIAVDKNLGVRPIGIGETIRRIIAKASISVIRSDILDAAGCQQLCVGQIRGVESGVYCVRKLLETCEAVIFVDASNAFNSLNRSLALRNVKSLCPSFATLLLNCYSGHTHLYIGGETILVNEGVTQGDLLAMPFYAISTIPLINRLRSEVTQVWYCDDAASAGSLVHLRKWWDSLVSLGPSYGYFPNPIKTWLVAKNCSLQRAEEIFDGAGIRITDCGRPYLGAPIGSSEYVLDFLNKKINVWMDELSSLAKIANSQPHAAFSALIRGLMNRWSFICRTVADDQGTKLELKLQEVFLPIVTGRLPLGPHDRNTFSLPARLGGLGISDFVSNAPHVYEESLRICLSVVEQIVSKSFKYDYECEFKQVVEKSAVRRERSQRDQSKLSELQQSISQDDRLKLRLAGEKGVTVLPIREFGFALHKRNFIDALHLRYGWLPKDLPLFCACGSRFTVNHALSCLNLQ